MSRREWRTLRDGLLFISPWIIGFGMFSLWSILSSLYFSFTEYDGATTPQWIGLGNYQHLFSDGAYVTALGNTVYYIVGFLPAGTLVALALGMNYFIGLYSTHWQELMAYATLMTVPMIALFFVAQRAFIRGIALTGLGSV